MRFMCRVGLTMLKGGIELLLFLPLLLVAIVYLLPDSVRWIWLATLPLCYAAGFTVGSFIPITRLYQLLLIIACLGGGYSYLLFGGEYVLLLSVPIACAAVYRGIKLVMVPWYVMFPASFMLFGMILYFFGSVVLHFLGEFQPYMPLLTWGGVVSLAATLFMTNESNMKQESLPGDKEPVIASEMKWKNRLLIGVILFLIVCIVAFRMLQSAVVWVKEQLAALLRALFTPSDRPPATAPEESPPAMLPEFVGNEEPAYWLVVLEKIFYYITAAIVIGVLLLLVYFIARKIPGWVRLVFSWLVAKLRSSDVRSSRTGYEDDVESLMDWDKLSHNLLSGWKRWFGSARRHEKWEDLTTNSERIRFLYRQWLRQSIQQGYRFKRYLTARETGRELEQWDKTKHNDAHSLLSLYDNVRYGSKDVTDVEVANVKQAAEKKN